MPTEFAAGVELVRTSYCSVVSFLFDIFMVMKGGVVGVCVVVVVGGGVRLLSRIQAGTRTRTHAH